MIWCALMCKSDHVCATGSQASGEILLSVYSVNYCVGAYVYEYTADTECFVQSSGFGQLKDGYLITSNTHYARRLLSRPPCAVLAALGKHLKQFEVAIGLNGKIWVHSPSLSKTVIACNAIQRAEFMSAAQIEVLVSKLVDVAESGQD